MRVTDLEKFVREEIYNPYKNMIEEKITLSNARLMLIKNKEWAKLVLGRLSKMDITFPSYVNHQLVRFIKNAVTIKWEG